MAKQRTGRYTPPKPRLNDDRQFRSATARHILEENAVLREGLSKAVERIQKLEEALQDIFNWSRDDGLAAMCNQMRGRAGIALRQEPDE